MGQNEKRKTQTQLADFSLSATQITLGGVAAQTGVGCSTRAAADRHPPSTTEGSIAYNFNRRQMGYQATIHW